MTDLEISKALALTIGWEHDQMKIVAGNLFVADWPRKDNRLSVLQNKHLYPVPLLPWKKFDYKDWTILGPLAEIYDAYPDFCDTGEGEWWVAGCRRKGVNAGQGASTPQKACAMALIKGIRR
jgi:hypothetical protein